jgi:hypothetical protein
MLFPAFQFFKLLLCNDVVVHSVRPFFENIDLSFLMILINSFIVLWFPFQQWKWGWTKGNVINQPADHNLRVRQALHRRINS